MKIGDSGGGDLFERLQAGAQAHRRPQKTRGCPDEDRLRLLLPGQLDHAEADELLTHAATCDWCGMVLREAVQDLSDPPTGAEEELAGKARLADPLIRKEFAERIAGGGRSDPKPFRKRFPKPFRKQWYPILRWWPAWVLGAAAVATLLGVVIYPQWARGSAHTERLLAEAYTKDRPMEMRLPGAEWSHGRTQRGTASSSFSEPLELSDAISNIKRALDTHPDDPKWLQLEGRADLLEGKEDASITELERAHALRPADASILLDWGMALFQKAEQLDDAKVRAEACERFSEGVRLNPKDPALLFNRALAAQSMYAYHEALDDWKAYLKVDSQSGWAQEARQHLDEVKKNLSGSAPTSPPPPPTH
jgi:tetratricopeptide (TPR) repeat protein